MSKDVAEDMLWLLPRLNKKQLSAVIMKLEIILAQQRKLHSQLNPALLIM